MVMMKKCCCFANTVSGSIASGVFSANYSAIHLVWTGFQWYQISQTNGAEFSRYGAYAADIIDVIALICLAITSVLLIYGVAEDMWMYLIPYVATIPVLLVLQIITWIVRISITAFYADAMIFGFIVWIFLLPVHIICILCVVSLLQEFRTETGKEDIEHDIMY
ncbi:uncharacterized protein LOC121406441 [Lytechinus variegatus]|uniref:uncharacterized protein LOC121406441 n=1 Tax=Lytechinus variegatus TaxID=7654 RepID=UPI001BB1271B|nr:uncharacterized protein LOC121406441 [Lytechinus variegatus]